MRVPLAPLGRVRGRADVNQRRLKADKLDDSGHSHCANLLWTAGGLTARAEWRGPEPAAEGGRTRMGARSDAISGDGVLALAAELSRRAAHYGVPACECEDCVQEAWLALLMCHPDWRPDGPRARAWLFAVVRNKAVDLHRRVKRCVSLDSDRVLTLPAYPEPPGDQPRTARNKWRRDAVLAAREALNGLSELDREVFAQRVEADLTWRQMSTVFGTDAARLKARYYRTLRKLRQAALPPVHGCADKARGVGLAPEQ
jgi:RNA polymerase sigma factor (sigma-70 family)